MAPKADSLWLNGTLVPWNQANVHILTHALHYSGAVFEGIRAYPTAKGAAVFRLPEHLSRLQRSAEAYSMPLPYSVEQLTKATVEVMRANKLPSAYIRPIAFRGAGEMGLNPVNPVDVSIIAWTWGAYLGEAVERGAHCVTSTWRRISPSSFPVQAKGSANYSNSMLAKLEALRQGCDEAILLNDAGRVAEGPGENIFVVRDGEILTPGLGEGVLDGITRNTVMVLARERGYPVKEEAITRDMVYAADEVFFTGTAAEVTPVSRVDGHAIGSGKPGRVTLELREAYLSCVTGKDPRHEAWLTRV